MLCVKADGTVVGEKGKYEKAVGFPIGVLHLQVSNCLSKRTAKSVYSFENASSFPYCKHKLTAFFSEIIHYKTILTSLILYSPFIHSSLYNITDAGK